MNATTERPDLERSNEPSSPRAIEDANAILVRIDERLRSIDARLESLTRERQHRDFSAVRLLGVLLQVLAAGALVLSLATWVYQESSLGQQLFLILLAAVFQLGALTAFVIAGAPKS